jgi:SagB-type dehydrogenase family enzyme
LEQLSQILWAAQGITGERGKRAAPSAGMTYPLELYVLVRRVEGLGKGVYRYNPQDHSLELVKSGDYSDKLMRAAVNQEWVKDGSINIIITADFWRTTSTYGERGRRYVYLEAGHAAQNIYLQVTALRLGCVVIGAFSDEDVKNVLSLPENHKPIYLIPVGYPS